MVARLVTAFKPERIYLFGSKARGDDGPDGDYDLLMVLSHVDEPLYRLAQEAHSLFWGLGTAADIQVWPRDRFESRLHLRASLPAAVVREGRLLYAACSGLGAACSAHVSAPRVGKDSRASEILEALLGSPAPTETSSAGSSRRGHNPANSRERDALNLLPYARPRSGVPWLLSPFRPPVRRTRA